MELPVLIICIIAIGVMLWVCFIAPLIRVMKGKGRPSEYYNVDNSDKRVVLVWSFMIGCGILFGILALLGLA